MIRVFCLHHLLLYTDTGRLRTWTNDSKVSTFQFFDPGTRFRCRVFKIQHLIDIRQSRSFSQSLSEKRNSASLVICFENFASMFVYIELG